MSQTPLSVETRATIRKRRVVSIVSLLVIAIIFGLITIYVGLPLAKQFQESPETLKEYIRSQGLAGPLIMIGIMVLQVVVALIPGEPFEVAAGFIFGWAEGALLCLIGSALSGGLIFLAVRKWGVKLVEAFFPPEKINRFSFMRSSKRLNLLMFILFLIPGTPKDVINYVAGLTPMKALTFVGITTLARIPSVISSTISGQLLEEQQWLAAAITYGVTALISLICVLWYRKASLEEKHQKNESPAVITITQGGSVE